MLYFLYLIKQRAMGHTAIEGQGSGAIPKQVEASTSMIQSKPFQGPNRCEAVMRSKFSQFGQRVFTLSLFSTTHIINQTSDMWMLCEILVTKPFPFIHKLLLVL